MLHYKLQKILLAIAKCDKRSYYGRENVQYPRLVLDDRL